MIQVLKSSRVFGPDGPTPASIVFENGQITAVERFESALRDTLCTDVGDLCVIPGVTDTHVHTNEPGRTDWEGFATATRAAAAGGCTCLVDMPLNSIPAVTSVAALTQKREAAQSFCSVDYAFWGGVVPGNACELIPLARAGVRGFKCFLIESGVAEFACVSRADLDAAMPLVARTGLPLLVHAELPGPVLDAQQDLSRQGADVSAYATHLKSRPDEAEAEAVEMMVELCRKHVCRVHVVHLSSAKALPLIAKAKAEGLPLTVETCPHYLYFAGEAIPTGRTDFKCAPPIRGADNRELLWDALRAGDIDLIASDHSPCPPELKCLDHGDFAQAWGGIASLSVSLPVIWTVARQRGMALMDVVRWMCEKPAALARLEARKGRIAPGYDADLVVFDPDKQIEVTRDRLHFRHPISPYVGAALYGEVKMTFVRGHRVFANGSFPNERPGIEALP